MAPRAPRAGDPASRSNAGPVYRGRFAPSPTGPLHFGSLVAAVGSFLEARTAQGTWLVRIEDLDRRREVSGAATDILRTLDAFGFEWDGPVLYQSTRTDAYAHAIANLRSAGLVYPCACSRREVAARGQPGVEGPVYPGTCRNGLPPGKSAHSLRLRTRSGLVQIQDRIQGALSGDLSNDVGDFVLRRSDGIHAYQIAVVVDDAFQEINQVVRGADLIASTPRQKFLLQALGLPVPAYGHLPVVVDSDGRKLSKSHAAAPVKSMTRTTALLQAWSFLDQEPFPERPASLAEFWIHAFSTWSTQRVPSQRARALKAT